MSFSTFQNRSGGRPPRNRSTRLFKSESTFFAFMRAIKTSYIRQSSFLQSKGKSIAAPNHRFLSLTCSPRIKWIRLVTRSKGITVCARANSATVPEAGPVNDYPLGHALVIIELMGNNCFSESKFFHNSHIGYFRLHIAEDIDKNVSFCRTANAVTVTEARVICEKSSHLKITNTASAKLLMHQRQERSRCSLPIPNSNWRANRLRPKRTPPDRPN
jgi:hypothetical protein